MAVEQPSDLRVSSELVDFGICVVTASGALDVRSLPRFRDELVRAIGAGAREIVVDLTAARSVDGAAIALMELADRIKLRRGQLVLAAPKRFASALAATDLPVFPSVTAAMRQLAGSAGAR